MSRMSLTEAPPTAELELTANWPTASLSSSRTELSLNPHRKSLHREKRLLRCPFILNFSLQKKKELGFL